MDLDKIPIIVTIAPLTDLSIKNWGMANYKKLIEKILEYNDLIVVLIGNKNQTKELESLTTINSNRVINMAGRLSIFEKAHHLLKYLLFSSGTIRDLLI